MDGAIHRAAGPELVKASRALAPCPAGEAVVTPAFKLPAKFVIHAVGPIWRGGGNDEEEVLSKTYASVFARAREHAVRSIALPAISTGVYGFPKDRAAEIAVAAMLENEPHFDRIIACVFDSETREHYRTNLPSPSGRG